MYNEILDGIVKKLQDLFPEMEIMIDPLREGEGKPCFHVGITKSEEQPVNGNRYFRSIGVSIKYYPKEPGNASREMNQVLAVLMDEFEYVLAESGSTFKGSSRNGTIEGGVLYFQVDYQIYILKSHETEQSMENMKLM
ncbi:phage tail terminator family protein [Lacrimispora sp. JR3]|uniref:phage tail terminator family protein n=1 Tax=Lacrimispora sinapis TaxID=3111456 RepID=UPI0037481FCF